MDEELAAGLKIAKKKPCNYVLVWKDVKKVKLIVSKKKIKPALVKQARKELKATKMLGGTCYGEGGTNIVFERLADETEPPRGAMLLKLLINEQTGMKFKPEFREVAALTDVPEEDDEEAASDDDAAVPTPEEPAGETAAPGPAPELLTALRELMGLFDQHQDALPDRDAKQLRTALKKVAVEVRGAKTGPAQAKTLEYLAKLRSALHAKSAAARPKGGPRPIPIALTVARLTWLDARKAARAGLAEVEAAILEQLEADPDIANIGAAASNLYQVLDKLDTRLVDKLDEALNATTDDARTSCHRQARTIVKEYRDYVSGDPLMKSIDTNPFQAVTVQADLLKTLDELDRHLASAV